MKTYVIYHYPCLDGLVAAWAFNYWHYNYNNDIIYLPTDHAQTSCTFDDIDKFKNATVYCLDYCPHRDVLLKLLNVVYRIYIYDHHKSSYDILSGIQNNKLTYLLDMRRSGAGITWDVFSCNMPRPLLVNLIEDNDLYTNKLNGHAEFTAWLDFCKPKTFDEIEEINKKLCQHDGFDFTKSGEPYSIGSMILSYRKKMIEKICDFAYDTVIDGITLKTINSSVIELNSDIGNFLVAKYNMPSLVWYYRDNNTRVNSFRSRDDLYDVSLLAVKYGGGGHRNAAGFIGR